MMSAITSVHFQKQIPSGFKINFSCYFVYDVLLVMLCLIILKICCIPLSSRYHICVTCIMLYQCFLAVDTDINSNVIMLSGLF